MEGQYVDVEHVLRCRTVKRAVGDIEAHHQGPVGDPSILMIVVTNVVIVDIMQGIVTDIGGVEDAGMFFYLFYETV